MITAKIIWSDPIKIKSNGSVLYKREWFIPYILRKEFFAYWKTTRHILLARGYSVEKRNDKDWYLIETKKSINEFIELKQSVPIYNHDNTPLPPYTVKNTSGLKPWQINAVSKIVSAINKWNCAVDGSELGLGKTYTACAVARELNMKIAVICPKAVKESWRRVIKNHFNMQDSCIDITNYESLRTGNTKNKMASYFKVPKSRRKKFIWKLPKNTLIIWDEAQRLKNYKSKNSKTCMEAFKQGYKMLFCSATLASNPLDLKTVGECIKLFSGFKQYYSWATDHGCTRGYFGGLEFNYNKKALIKLHNDVFVNRGIRLLRDSIKDFPECQISANCYDIGNEDTLKANNIYAEMQNELIAIEKRRKKDIGAIKLVTLLRARQKVEMLKVPILVEMTENSIENGMSVVIFCNFTETIEALSTRLNTECIVNGTIKEKIRQKNIDNFQNGQERVILVNISAGGSGLSLHNINGNYPRKALICPNYSAILMRQATGRIWRTGSKTKCIQEILFIANTIEEEVCKKVNIKLNNMDLLNDGDLLDSTTSNIIEAGKHYEINK